MRPLGATALAALNAAGGAAAASFGFTELGSTRSSAAAACTAGVGLGYLVLAWALFDLRRWAWSATAVFHSINVGFAIVIIAMQPRSVIEWVLLAGSSLVLLLLARPEVRLAYGLGAAADRGGGRRR